MPLQGCRIPRPPEELLRRWEHRLATSATRIRAPIHHLVPTWLQTVITDQVGPATIRGPPSCQRQFRLLRVQVKRLALDCPWTTPSNRSSLQPPRVSLNLRAQLPIMMARISHPQNASFRLAALGNCATVPGYPRSHVVWPETEAYQPMTIFDSITLRACSKSEPVSCM